MNLSKLKFNVEVNSNMSSLKEEKILIKLSKKMIRNYIRMFSSIPLPNKDIQLLNVSFGYSFFIEKIYLFEDMNYIEFIVALNDEEEYIEWERKIKLKNSTK